MIFISCFFLDGLINEAHKENKINKALAQIVQYSNALGMVGMMNSDKDTLVLSMSNFGSTLTIAGSAVSILLNFCLKL